jgi:hypothetical protein
METSSEGVIQKQLTTRNIREGLDDLAAMLAPVIGTTCASPARWKNCGQRRMWVRFTTDLGPVGGNNME